MTGERNAMETFPITKLHQINIFIGHANHTKKKHKHSFTGFTTTKMNLLLSF